MDGCYNGRSDEDCYPVFDDDLEQWFKEPDEQNQQSSLDTNTCSSCKVITKASLLAAQKADLQRVMDLLSLKEQNARTMLIHYHWNVDKLFSVFVERGEEYIYAEAGLSMEDHKTLLNSQSTAYVTCEICYEDVHVDEMTIMDCGHSFCNDCWTEHFIVKINDGQSRHITCMAHKCNTVCDEAKIRSLVGARDPDLAEKFDRFLLQSYIEDNKRVKWCPSVPHCGNAIRVEDDEYCEVECACGLQFCFRCSAEPHSPCSCLMWELWMRKCTDDIESESESESKSINWITVNTKQCPQCDKPVEKNGGCNLITCICGQQFCWLCGGALDLRELWNHGRSCEQYKEKEKKETTRKERIRFYQYYNLYKAHTDSLKSESSMQEIIREKVSTLEAREFASMDFSWVTNGLSRLFKCRRILSYSYPFAYWMFGDEMNEMEQFVRVRRQNIFEKKQHELEAKVEQLSMFLEEPFADYPEDKVLDIKMKVIMLSAVTDELCKKLYEDVEKYLLPTFERAAHIIAPYNSNGVEKASKLLKRNSDTIGRVEAGGKKLFRSS